MKHREITMNGPGSSSGSRRSFLALTAAAAAPFALVALGSPKVTQPSAEEIREAKSIYNLYSDLAAESQKMTARMEMKLSSGLVVSRAEESLCADVSAKVQELAVIVNRNAGRLATGQVPVSKLRFFARS